MGNDSMVTTEPALTNLLDLRLLLVTGKGGVGKSSVAAALAVAGAWGGRRTCLVEVEGRQTMAKLFSTQPWDFSEREFRPDLWGTSVDPEASLREYLDLFYGAGRLSRVVVGSSALDFVTTAAPGIKDVLLIGKVKEMERRRDSAGHFHYDLIVVDAPPTGRITGFLRAPEATTELVNVGPIRSQAQSVIDMLRDHARTAVVLVTMLEEMPIQETVDGAAALEGLGVALGPVFVNRVLPARFDDDTRKLVKDDLPTDELAALLAEHGVDATPDLAGALREEGQIHLGRLALQEEMRARLADQLSLPTIELPFVYAERFGAEQVDMLARVVAEAVGEE